MASSPIVGESGDANMQDVGDANQDEMSVGLGNLRNARDEVYEEEGGVRIGDIYIPPPPPPACTFDPTGPRLIITCMEIENFKSYSEKVLLGPFHKNFTAVIGPNGSGKSNVIDAMLFVFGCRAQKIRSKKISALIHKSDQFPNCNSCTVAVHFSKIIDVGETFTTVEGSGFVVSRTAFKDDTSYYCVDGRRLLFKEVSKILQSHGIDLDHSRFLILQGEVEHIAMMKPKGTSEHDIGMLEFLEDIIGCHRLKEPIEMLFQQVEELNEVKMQKMERVKMVQKDLDELRKAKDEAMKYIVLENEIVRMTNAVNQKLIFEYSAALKQVVDRKTKYEEDMSAALKEAEEIRVMCETRGKEYKKYQSKYEKIANKHDRMQEEFAELERNDTRIVDTIQHKNAKLTTLQENLTTEEKKLKVLTDSPATHSEEIAALEEKLLELNGKKKVQQENLVAVMSKLKEETNDFQQKKIEHEHALLGLRNITDAKKSAMCIAQSELDIYKSAEQTVAALLDKLRREYEESILKVNEKKKSIMDLKAEIEQLQTDVQRDKDELQKITDEFDHKKELVKDARTKTQQATDSLQSHRSRGRVLDYILNLKAKHVVQGIYGRLGDLGAIDAKYDVAVSMACGLLDHIVVDNVDIAEKCIQHLRRDNIGRASFIALDKMQTWNQYVHKKISTPENAPRLFDLINVPDERHLPAFYFALRDTLVADEINQATRIAFGATRYRVVTLQGHIIDQSGAMSGGGTQVSRNRMGRTVAACDYTQSQVKKMQQDLEKLHDEVKNLIQRKLDISQKVESGTARIPQLCHALQMSEMENRSLAEQVSSLKLQVKEQERRAKSVVCDATELARMQAVLDNATKDHNEAEVHAAKVEKKVKKLDDEIAKISGGRVESAQTRIDDVCKEIDETNAKITKLKASIKTSAGNAKKCAQKLQKLQTEIKDLGSDLKGLENQCKQIEEKAKVYVEKVRDIMALRDSEKKKGDDLRQELNVLQEKDSKQSSDSLKFKHQIEEYDRQISMHRGKIQKLEKELSKLVLQETDTTDTVLPRLSEEEIQELNNEEMVCARTLAQGELAKLKPNPAAIQEYKKKETVYLQRVAELEDITDRRNSKRQAYDGLKKRRLDEFMDGYKIISSKLKETYQMITLGGDADLELANSLDPFSEGIVFSVRPPRKSWKSISNLSGGEKTLSSLALVFALHYYKPTPLYVMDEIDAALDYRNVSIIGYYIKERTKNAQFIIISLRNNMFELADTLVGIYKTYNSSKSIMVNLPR